LDKDGAKLTFSLLSQDHFNQILEKKKNISRTFKFKETYQFDDE
jgi:hypothetical protein